MSTQQSSQQPANRTKRPLVPGWLWAIIAVLAIIAAIAYMTGGSKAAAAKPFQPAEVAVAKYASLPVYAKPGGPLTRSLPNPDPSNYNQRQVLLVLQDDGDWLKVSLPIEPNGQTGWVKTQQVSLTQNDYRVDIAQSAHQLRVYKKGVLAKSYPIAVGKADTPTPGGTYFIRVLLKPPNPNGAYGPYAYGLSGYSAVLKDYAGGAGVIGMHGTDQPQLIGQDVSHGCVRLRNADITDLVQRFHLKLGTPVRILA